MKDRFLRHWRSTAGLRTQYWLQHTNALILYKILSSVQEMKDSSLSPVVHNWVPTFGEKSVSKRCPSLHMVRAPIKQTILVSGVKTVKTSFLKGWSIEIRNRKQAKGIHFSVMVPEWLDKFCIRCAAKQTWKIHGRYTTPRLSQWKDKQFVFHWRVTADNASSVPQICVF